MNRGTRLVLLAIFLLTFPSLALAAKTHVVKKNDNLSSLSKKYHVSVREIKSSNNMVNSHLKPGGKLIIPKKNVASASDRSAAHKSKSPTYKVHKGDTLKTVAKRTGIPVAELKRLNGVTDKSLKPGRCIVLRNSAPVEHTITKNVRRYSLRNAEISSNEEYERTIAELNDSYPEKPVDLEKDLEMTTDASKRLKKSAFSFLGARYRFGGNSRTSLDCSSFVQQVFRELKINLPRTAREQYVTGEPVTSYDLQKGDLLFFRTYASFPSHVGIYLGENKMIHASSRDRKVVISSMNTAYYRSRFIGAKRHTQLNPNTMRLEDLLSATDALEETDDQALKNDTMGVSLNN